jgi:hypothetical protein
MLTHQEVLGLRDHALSLFELELRSPLVVPSNEPNRIVSSNMASHLVSVNIYNC